RRGRQDLGALRGYSLVGIGMCRAVGKVLGEDRLSCRIDRELDELTTHISFGGALQNRPALGGPQVLVPNDVNWSAIVDGGLRTTIPRPADVDFAALQELRGLGPTRPPHVDVLLDGIELLEGPVEVQGI